MDEKEKDAAIDERGSTPDLESVQKELEQMKKLNEELSDKNSKYKNRIDELTHEQAENKRQARAKMSEDEKRQEEIAEKENQIKELTNKVQVQDKTTKYQSLGFDIDTAKKVAAAEVDGDMDAVYENLANLIKKKEADAEAEFIKQRPKPQVGGDSKNTEDDPFVKGFTKSY